MSRKIDLIFGIVFAILFFVCGTITIINIISNNFEVSAINAIAVITCGYVAIVKLFDAL